MSTETVGLLETGAQDGHLDFSHSSWTLWLLQRQKWWHLYYFVILGSFYAVDHSLSETIQEVLAATFRNFLNCPISRVCNMSGTGTVDWNMGEMGLVGYNIKNATSTCNTSRLGHKIKNAAHLHACRSNWPSTRVCLNTWNPSVYILMYLWTCMFKFNPFFLPTYKALRLKSARTHAC